MRILASCFVAVICLTAPSAALAQEAAPTQPFILRVHVTDKESQIPLLAAMQLDLAGIDVKADTADFVGDWRTFQDLLDAGFDPKIVWTPPATLQVLSQYLDPVEVSQRLDLYQASYPTLAKKVQVATTANGRSEWAMKISDNVNLEEDEPVVLYVGQHHAREVMTPEIALDIVDYLLTRYTTDSVVTSWVDGREVWVVPNHNPDGTDTVFTSNNNWRKNRRNNGDGTFGVDPNRNYPFHWNWCNGSSGSTSSDTYRGPSAGSEPETQGLVQLASDHRPAVSLSYHTYSELVIHPYGCTSTTNSETRFFRDYTSDMAFRLRNDANDGWYSNGTPWELLYEVDGDSDGWLYGELGVVATTIEANSSTQGFQPDYNTWRDQTVLRNRPAWQYLLDRIDGPSVWGHTTDACTGAPLSATLSIDEIVLANGETPRTSEPGYGRYHRLTIPGSWHLRAAKPGYQTQVWPVDVGFRASRREVRLVPVGSFAVEVLSSAIEDGSGDSDGQVDPGETVTMTATAYATGGAVTGLTGILSTSDPYVTITDANGAWPAFGAGGSAVSTDGFALSVSPGAPDGHVIALVLTFSADPSLCAPASSFDVRVTTHAPTCPAMSEPLDANPGWTIQNNNASGWAFGAPASGGVGGPGAAHTGANVFGTNLTGNYTDSADYKLITTPFNLTELRGTELRFWRWLNDEAGYDLASIDISTDGINYTNVWSGFGRDTRWEEYRYDISAIADGEPTVYVRFRLQSDIGTVASGFYIDDVSICGETAAPAPSIAVTNWSLDDGIGSCSDHDAYADAGEIAELAVSFRNNGSAGANGATAILSSTDPRIVPIQFQAALGNLAPGGTTSATFRFRVADAAACLEPALFHVDLGANGGAYEATDTSIALTLHGDTGAPVPDAFENFEGATSWALTGEWQIGPPLGKGGTLNGGSGNPDPTSAVSGTKVLGIDLSGLGAFQGNYENNLTTAITATSPVYDCTNSQNVQLQFKRWLGAERSFYDKATIDVWNGTAWQQVWMNPDTAMSDASWQSVSYDVTPWAAGNPSFQVRFKMTTDGSVIYCGWNIDDLSVTNGYTPQGCETSACAAGCTPASEIDGVTVAKAGGATRVDWTGSASACHGALGGAYRVYRATDPSRLVTPATQWPQDSHFADVTTLDTDGSASNESYSEADAPQAGEAFFYLVVDVGTSGEQGPKGWQGL